MSDTEGNSAYGRKPFKRSRSHFADRITADGRDGWPVEAGRYRLVVSRACPWASRAVISRRLLGLEDALSLAVADPIQDDRSWRFTLDPDGRDPVLGIRFLQRGVRRARDGLPGRRQRPRDRGRAQRPAGHQRLPADHARPGHRVDGPAPAGRARPVPRGAARRDRRGRWRRSTGTSTTGCTGPGSPPARRSTRRPTTDVFRRLELLSERLAGPALPGRATRITEADIRLFTTLVRFDAVYHGHFKCNRCKLTEDPVLWAYARDLYQTPGFGDTVDFDHIKRHYYQVHTGINPTGIVPARARTCPAG